MTRSSTHLKEELIKAQRVAVDEDGDRAGLDR